MLSIQINSFSYKNGYPKDNSGNGGGFVFDMRGILNPGREDAYKTLSGLDEPVKKFILAQTQMKVYLAHVFALIDMTVDAYLLRNFEHLQVNFGCTGGQHRSVFAAEALAAHLSKKYPNSVQIQVNHTNRSNWLKQIATP